MIDSFPRANRQAVDTLLISRPVLDGEKLAGTALEIGKRIFSPRSVGFIELPDEEQSMHYGMRLNSLTALTLPSIKVVDPDEMVLRMFERSAPRERNFAGKFRYASNKLIEIAAPVYKPKVYDDADAPVKYRTSGLYETLTSIGLDYNVLDQVDIGVRIGGLAYTTPSTRHDGSVQLSLSLHSTDRMTQMLHEQADACRQGLMQHSAKVGSPFAPHQIHIPFCTLPSNASQEKRDMFVDNMLEHVQNKRLRLGGVNMEVL